MSREGKLGCDIWLIHLTGEEFPSDCLGARHLCQQLVEGTLKLRLAESRERDLSKVQIQGAFVLDMVAHNSNSDRDKFQISPGRGAEAMWLAYQAHIANEIWNAYTLVWNGRPSRRTEALESGVPIKKSFLKSRSTRNLMVKFVCPAILRVHSITPMARSSQMWNPRSAFYGELRYQPQGISRQPRYDGKH